MKVPQILNTSKLAFLAGVLVAAAGARATEVHPPEGVQSAAPCAVLDRFEGEVQILDPSRSQLIDTTLKSAVPCNGWISVREGWAELHHKQGYSIKLGPDTFVEVFDSSQTTTDVRAHLVLYRGRMIVQAKNGMEPVRVFTANARVGLKAGSALVAFSPNEEETQLVTLEQEGTLANRFQNTREMTVHAGEMSALNFKLLRVVPDAPSAIQIASLKEILQGMSVTPRERQVALTLAQRRLDRKLASTLNGRAHAGRSIASIKNPQNASSGGSRPAWANRAWVSHLTGGDPAGSKILYPETASVKARARKSGVQVIDPMAEMERKNRQAEDAEKKRLIEELSKIQAE